MAQKNRRPRHRGQKRLLGSGSRLNRKAYGDVLMLILVGVMAVFSFFPLLMAVSMAAVVRHLRLANKAVFLCCFIKKSLLFHPYGGTRGEAVLGGRQSLMGLPYEAGCKA